MQTLTFSNKNGSIIVGAVAPYYLQVLDGISGLSAVFTDQKSPGQDGSRLVQTTFDKRYIAFTGYIKGTSQADLDEKRRIIQNLFNPKIESTLVYTNEYIEKQVTCRVTKTPVFTADQGTFYQVFIANIVCHNPFWEDCDTTGKTLSLQEGLFSFPWSFSDAWEIENTGTNRLEIDNTGDEETPVLITFKGAAVNPRILNETTGESIGINTTLLMGESLIINTENGNKFVIFDNGLTQVSAFGLINPTYKKFWKLATGVNIISYTADAGITTSNMLIQYKKRFIGL